MPKLRIVTQTDNIEKGDPHTTADNWMDDCAWATIACAANYLTGSHYTSFDGVAWGEKVGRHDRDGKGDPSSLAQSVKASRLAGLKGRWPKSWAEIEEALKNGAVIGINVEQARNYPAGLKMSAWHHRYTKRNPGKTYGHMTCAILGEWADPTMTGKGAEQWAVPVTLEQIKQLASSKGNLPHSRCIIWTAAKPAVAPAPATPAIVPAPTAPVVPAKPEPRNPAPFDYHAVAIPAPSPIKFSGLRGAIARAGARLIGRIAK